MVDKIKIAPHVALMDIPGPPTTNFTIKDFDYDQDRDLYTCPNGKELRHQRRNYKVPRSGMTKDKKRMYRALGSDCAVCPLKHKCCPNARSRRVGRSVYEHARDEVRKLQSTEEYEQSRRDRKKVEMSFAQLKCQHGFRRLKLRGPTGANDEFLLAATTENLKKLAKYATKPSSTLQTARAKNYLARNLHAAL